MKEEKKRILNSYEQYLDIERSLSKSSIKSRVKIAFDIVNFFDDKEIDEIDTVDIRAFLAFYKNNRIWKKSSTFHVSIVMIKSFFKFLAKEGIINKDPAKIIGLPRYDKEKVIKSINDTELKRLTKVLNSSRFTHQDRAIFHTLLSTGMRISELLSLKKDTDYIDINNRKIFLAKTKTRRPHYVMFSKEAQYFLKQHLIESQMVNSKYLFHNKKGKPLIRQRIRDKITEIINLAFPYNWNKPRGPHLLRHTFATNWVKSGANLIGLQSIMGWHSLKMTEVYVHQSEDLVTKAYEDFEKKKKGISKYAKKTFKTI